MNSEEDFSNWLDETSPALVAWGKFVMAEMIELLKSEIGEKRFKAFFKVCPSFRVKDKQSALSKLKLKRYLEPKEQMTDLVGVRFVVLLKSDIEVLEKALIEHPGWVRSKDRDPVGEQEARPKHFDYQSVHYIVRVPEEKQIDGIVVPEGLPCEVQIRTVLQHAYAELVHDKFYKGIGYIPPSADRLVARCMALMETTDFMFVEAVKELQSIKKSREQWCSDLDLLVGPHIPGYRLTAEDPDALEILEEYRDLLNTACIEDVRKILDQHVVNDIQTYRGQGNLYAKPIVLLVYWLLKSNPYQTVKCWPVPALRSGLEQVCGRLGISCR